MIKNKCVMCLNVTSNEIINLLANILWATWIVGQSMFQIVNKPLLAWEKLIVEFCDQKRLLQGEKPVQFLFDDYLVAKGLRG